jgi:hypothetical protein
MPSSIVLPTLTHRNKSHISAVIETTTQADLGTALDAFLLENAGVNTVNGVTLFDDQSKTLLQGETFQESKAATLVFTSEFKVPTDPLLQFRGKPAFPTLHKSEVLRLISRAC